MKGNDLFRLIHNAIGLGLHPESIVENAGRSLAEMFERYRHPTSHLLIVVTGGFYGCTGLVAARHLSARGWQITILQVDIALIKQDETFETIYKDHLCLTRRLQHSIEFVSSTNMKADWERIDLVFIASTETNWIIENLLSQTHCPVLGLLDNVDTTMLASIRPTTDGDKIAIWSMEDLGLPREAQSVVGPGDLRSLLMPHPTTAVKGDYGLVLVIGGSFGRLPAPSLAGIAALRTGVDGVALLIPSSATPPVWPAFLCLYTHPFQGDYLGSEDYKKFVELLQFPTLRCVLIGPGLGLNTETVEVTSRIIRDVLAHKIPLVLDADALKMDILGLCTRPWSIIITPNSKEFQTLFGVSLSLSAAERLEQVTAKAKQYGLVIVLKGSRDMISDGNRYRWNETGHPAMTVAGTGDVLSGLVAGFCGQRMDLFEAACLGSFVCGQAGQLAFQRWGYSLSAVEILEVIPEILRIPELRNC